MFNQFDPVIFVVENPENGNRLERTVYLILCFCCGKLQKIRENSFPDPVLLLWKVVKD